MCQLNNDPILPSLKDYSILTDYQLECEITICCSNLNTSEEPHFTEFYQNRLQMAEQELERRYLLS